MVPRGTEYLFTVEMGALRKLVELVTEAWLARALRRLARVA